MRVATKVIQFPGVDAVVEVDELVAACAYAVVRPHAVPAADALVPILVVVVVHRRAPVAGRVALQQRPHGGTLDIRRQRATGQVDERGCEIEVQHDVVADRAGADHARVAHQQRHAQRLLVHEALVVPTVVAEEEALVGRIHDHGVARQAALVEVIQQPADIVINRRHAAQVVLDIALILPLLLCLSAQSLRRRAFAVAVHEVVLDRHGLVPGGLAACGVVVVERLRLGNIDALVHAGVLRVRHPVAMGRLVLTQQQERPA